MSRLKRLIKWHDRQRYTVLRNHGGIMKIFKSLLRISIAVIILLVSYSNAIAQNEKKIAKGTISRLSSDAEFAFSETYAVINPKSIYIDADLRKYTATICFSSHPVYTFAVELIDYKSDAVSISGRYLELTGNGTASFYIDRAEKKVFLKRRSPDGSVRKIFYGAVTIERSSLKKERILFKRDSDLMFIIHNAGGQVRADFYYKDFFMFSLNVKQLKVNNIVNPDVWDLTGNTADVLSFNTSRKILYYRQRDPKTTWAGVIKSEAN